MTMDGIGLYTGIVVNLIAIIAGFVAMVRYVINPVLERRVTEAMATAKRELLRVIDDRDDQAKAAVREMRGREASCRAEVEKMISDNKERADLDVKSLSAQIEGVRQDTRMLVKHLLSGTRGE
jgi:hypothetical protein